MKHATFVQGLTEILQKRNAIKSTMAKSLAKAFKDSEKPYFDEFLLDEGLVDKDDLLQALGEYYQVPPFDAIGYFFDHALVRMFPLEIMLSNAFIPIEQDENIMVIAASNPNDTNLLPIIGEYVSYDIQFRVGIRQDIVDAVREYFDRSLTEVDYDEDLDNERVARVKEREKEEELEDFAYKDFEKNE